MNNNSFSSRHLITFIRNFYSGKFSYLLISLLAMFMIYPLQDTNNTITAVLLQVFYFAILLSSLRAVSHGRPLLRNVLIVLMILSAIIHSIDFLGNISWLYAFGLWNDLIFYCLVVFAILGYVFESGHVNRDKIIGAVCVYLFMGIVFTQIYLLLHLYIPNSFAINAVPSIGGVTSVKVTEDALFYFSFITLTTVGFGDITPTSGPSASFSVLEALSGQIYLTVLVARLVGMLHFNRGSVPDTITTPEN